MKHFLASLLLLAPVSPLSAQQTGIDQASELLVVPTGDKFLHWYGHADRSYFLQVSDANNPLAKWFWAPVIEGGNDEEISYEVDGTASKGFFRLLHTTLQQPPGVSLEDWDADDDRLNNWEEITSHGSNPLKSDTDDDGLPDDWEIAHGLNALDDGTEDPDRGPDALFNSQPGGFQSASAFSAPQSPLSNFQAFLAGVRAVPGATLADKDGDLIQDGEDADPLSLAINWRKSPKPVYAAIPVLGWVPATHSFPVRLTNQNDVLTNRAVYKNGQWTPINAYYSAAGQGPALSYQFEVNGRRHSCHLGQCQSFSMNDQGDIMCNGKILIDPVIEIDPVTSEEVSYAAGYTPSFALIWHSPEALPEILGVAPGTILQGARHAQFGMLHRDGTVLLGKARPEDALLNNNSFLERWPNAASGGGIQTSPIFAALSFSYPAVGGSASFRNYLSSGIMQSWVWPATGTPKSLYTETISAPGAPGLNFQSSPSTIGTAPGGEACINLSGQVLVGHSGRYHQVPSLEGATRISPHGAALLPGPSGNPNIWYGGSTYSLSSCVSNPQALGSTLTVTDINDDGSILATVDANTAAQKLVILVPIDILEVISDQIGGNEANKLPTEYYEGAPNNPMLMACRTGVQAHVAIKISFPAQLASSVLVGVRTLGSGYGGIMNSVASVPLPGKTILTFDVYNGGPDFCEIVAGYDSDRNHILSNDEVTTTFKKTPRTDSAGTPVAVDESIIDKIKIVTELEFANSKVDSLLNNVWGTDYTGDLISTFIHGATSVNEATSTYPHTIASNQTGLSHQVGARWNSSNSAETYEFIFSNGSEASEDVKASNALTQVLEETISSNISAIKLATPLDGSWGTSGTYHYTISKRFQDTESEWVGINELGYAFGKVEIAGSATISSRWIAGGKIEVGTVSYSAQFGDLYDFSFWPLGSKASIASQVQAGHATLSNTSEPNSGRVFFTKVMFSGSKNISQEY